MGACGSSEDKKRKQVVPPTVRSPHRAYPVTPRPSALDDDDGSGEPRAKPPPSPLPPLPLLPSSPPASAALEASRAGGEDGQSAVEVVVEGEAVRLLATEATGRLHATYGSGGRSDVDTYHLPDAHVLRTFRHAQVARLVPCDRELLVRCGVEVDVIVAVHQDNPRPVLDDFTRVITNNSYSRMLCSASALRGMQRYYRLYYIRVPPGEHHLNLNREASWKKTSMHSLTIFVREASASPPLDLKVIPDDSSPTDGAEQ